MMNLSQVLDAVMSLESKDDLQAVQSAVKKRWGGLNKRAVAGFRRGMRVSFNGRYNRVEVGTVGKVNTKTVSVDADSGKQWRVPPSMLKMLDEGTPAKQSPATDTPMPDWQDAIPADFRDMDAYRKAEEARWAEENKYQDTLPEGLVRGKLIRFQIADGYAYYRVVKVNKTTVRLRHQKMGGDDWSNPAIGFEGTLGVRQVAALIRQQEVWKKLMAKKAS